MRDRAWVNRIISGDKLAGERLVTENYARIYKLLRSLTGHTEVAEDLTQQTFAKAWQALATFRSESRLSTWLCRIAYHEYTHWRRDRREFAMLEIAADLPDTRAVVGLQTVMFHRALEHLSDDLRETFLLHYEHDLDVKEVSAILDVPAGTVKSRLFTARNRLRELLTDGGERATDAPQSSQVTIAAPLSNPIYATLEEKPL